MKSEIVYYCLAHCTEKLIEMENYMHAIKIFSVGTFLDWVTIRDNVDYFINLADKIEAC